MGGAHVALIDTLRAQKDFTSTDKALAEYILAHPDEAVRMSVSELAAETFTSSAAVNRLCHRIGSKGFREFKIDLNTELERRRSGKDVSANLKVDTGQSSLSTMSGVRNVFKKAIDDCFATISALDLHEAARSVLHAQRVIMYGAGDSEVACEHFGNDLVRIGITPIIATRNNLLWSATRLADKGDVALFVSYSGKVLDHLMSHIDVAREAGCRIIVVSSREADVSLAHRVDHYLKLPVGEDIMDSSGLYYSQMCMRYTLSCLYATAFSLDAESNDAHRLSVVAPDWMDARLNL